MDGEELTLIVSFGDTIARYGGPADGGEPRRLGIVYYVLRFTRRERQLFEKLNGDLSFETDNGTTIRITLPGRA